MVMSMSRKGNCWDNAAMESFFGSLKGECVGELIWRTGAFSVGIMVLSDLCKAATQFTLMPSAPKAG
jgi:transposase InsO family protein